MSHREDVAIVHRLKRAMLEVVKKGGISSHTNIDQVESS